ncbi:Cullin-4B, partial [Rhizopus stolonifer]
MFIDGQQLQSVIRMLLDLNVYQEFETCFLEETRQFYATEGNSLMQSMEMGEYLNHVSTRVHQESTVRVKRYFDKSTKAPLQAIVEEELLTKRVTQVLDKCFSYFHENYLVDELSLLYRLLKKVGQLDICAKYFTNYVKTKGSAILCDTLPLSEKMNTLSTFKKKNEYIVDHSFEGDEQFLDGLKDGTEYFINLRENNTIRLLARHADTVVKSEKMDERQVDQCMFLFHHLQAKDEFEVIFKRDLAKRLLLDTAHRNHERILLAKIKKESGVAFTSKLEGMLRDIKQSSELMQEFNDLSGQFYVNVLTHGFWPAYAPVQVSLPAALQELQDLYTVLYTQKYPRRQLTWQNSLGVCDVYANYPRGAKNITLTLLQAIVLLLFNHDTSLPFTSILQATRFDQVELIRTLQSLTSKEYKLLKKDPEGPIQPTDFFSYNPGFW